MGISRHSGQEHTDDTSRWLYGAAGMDEKAVRQAALVTLRRAILERFPPGSERRAWLRWLMAQRYRPLVQKQSAPMRQPTASR